MKFEQWSVGLDNIHQMFQIDKKPVNVITFQIVFNLKKVIQNIYYKNDIYDYNINFVICGFKYYFA